jgi:hypothetical protein
MTSQLLVDEASRTWRRRLGPLPWAVLEELALQARPSQQGWVAAVGVRDLGAAVGTTKDTAARALASLRSAGLVESTRVHLPRGPSRSGYRLNLPDGISIRRCPVQHDTGPHDGERCLHGQYTRRTHTEYERQAQIEQTTASDVAVRRTKEKKSSTTGFLDQEPDEARLPQPTLFDPFYPLPG